MQSDNIPLGSRLEMLTPWYAEKACCVLIKTTWNIINVNTLWPPTAKAHSPACWGKHLTSCVHLGWRRFEYNILCRWESCSAAQLVCSSLSCYHLKYLVFVYKWGSCATINRQGAFFSLITELKHTTELLRTHTHHKSLLIEIQFCNKQWIIFLFLLVKHKLWSSGPETVKSASLWSQKSLQTASDGECHSF